MIAIAEEIFNDVEAEAILLNGEVVRRAFQTVECCQFFENRADFYELLQKYELAKSVERSAWNRFKDRIGREEQVVLQWSSNMPIGRMKQNRFAYATECSQHSTDLRARLNAIWPCKECLDKYNPTRKKRPW